MVGVFVDPAVVDDSDRDSVKVIPPEASLFLCDDEADLVLRKTPPV